MNKEGIIETLKEYVKYDESSKTGLIYLKPILRKEGILTNRPRIGKAAGSKSSHGYWEIQILDKRYYVHRIVWMLSNGEIPSGYMIDHIDGDKTNNKLENLRLVDDALSNRNTGSRKHNTSGVKGVCWQTINGILYARAQWYSLDGKQRCKLFSSKKLGREKSFEEACLFRTQRINQLQADGAGYSKRHLGDK